MLGECKHGQGKFIFKNGDCFMGSIRMIARMDMASIPLLMETGLRGTIEMDTSMDRANTSI